MICSRQENFEWFCATIGGMGLTGFITWAEIDLIPIKNSLMNSQIIRFNRLEDFFVLSDESESLFDYTVAWIDSLKRGRRLGRGLFMRANHARMAGKLEAGAMKPRLSVPFRPNFSLINRTSLKIFNTLYYRKHLTRSSSSQVAFEPYFYPLDGIADWNRLYGPGGLVQHQSVYPEAEAPTVTRALLACTHMAGQGSFLTVLKKFGARKSPGLLSFARPGVTLTLDLPYQGAPTLDLLSELDAIVMEAGGAVNPYKDARMPPEIFAASFPDWEKLLDFKDPRFSSNFWRRVTGA
jgi:FAD/FMN-containing dehydrogenase